MEIASGRLKATVDEPGESYRGSRYDWSGNVRQVELDGEHTFFSTREEPPDTGLRGRGLMDVVESEDNLGYAQTERGNRFPLLGVGLLRKDSMEPFYFDKPYHVLPFERKTQRDKSSVSMVTYPMSANGYAVLETKTVSVAQDVLTIKTSFENAGTRRIRFKTFNHNFFCFDDADIGADYELLLPYDMQVNVRRGRFCAEYDRVSLQALDGDTASGAFLIDGFGKLGTHMFELRNQKLGLRVICEEDAPASRVYVWTARKSFSPEVFHTFDLAYGESCTYARKYTFTTL